MRSVVARRWLDVAGVADLLHTTRANIYQLVAARRIPYARLPGGRRLYFDADATDEMLQSAAVKPAQ